MRRQNNRKNRKKKQGVLLVVFELCVAVILISVLVWQNNKSVKQIQTTSYKMQSSIMSDGENGTELYPMPKEGKWGFVNSNNQFVIVPQYYSVGTGKFTQRRWAVVFTGRKKCTYVDKYGEIIAPDAYRDAYDFTARGIARVEKRVNGIQTGYINEKQEMIISCKYDEGGDFAENGLAFVGVTTEDGKEQYGYINEKGEQVIDFQYDRASDFASNGLACVVKKGMNDKRKSGYINERGEQVLDYIYDLAGNFAENGLAPVGRRTSGGHAEWGYIDASGKMVIDYQFSDAKEFAANGLAAVREPGDTDERKYGYINEKGELVIPYQYETGEQFSTDGYVPVATEDSSDQIVWGCINESGEEIVPCKYKKVALYKDLICIFKSKNKNRVYVGYVDYDGKWVIPLKKDQWF